MYNNMYYSSVHSVYELKICKNRHRLFFKNVFRFSSIKWKLSGTVNFWSLVLRMGIIFVCKKDSFCYMDGRTTYYTYIIQNPETIKLFQHSCNARDCFGIHFVSLFFFFSTQVTIIFVTTHCGVKWMLGMLEIGSLLTFENDSEAAVGSIIAIIVLAYSKLKSQLKW